MSLLRVLILNHNVEWRGTFQRCFDFAKMLTSRGHIATIVTNSPHNRLRFEEYELEEIRIIRSPDLLWGILRTGWDPMNVLRRYRYLKNQKFDIIHAFDNRPAVILPALKLKKRWSCPLVSDWCDWWGRGGAITFRKNKILNRMFEPIETFFEEYYRKDADFLTVISRPLKERAIRLGYPARKIEVIPPLVDTEKIFPVNQKEARKRLGLPEGCPIIIFSGFVLYDLELVLEAFRLVHREIPNCLLLLTGGIPKLAAKHSDLPVFNFGFVSQEKLRDCLGASDLCLLPLTDCLTNRARFPHKIGHYLAAGRPVMSNPVGEAGQLIGERQVGFLTDGEPTAFADGICRALCDLDKLAAVGMWARHVAEDYLSGDRYADRLVGIYKSCIESSLR